MAKTRTKSSAWLDEIMQERAPEDWSQHMAEWEHSKEDWQEEEEENYTE